MCAIVFILLFIFFIIPTLFRIYNGIETYFENKASQTWIKRMNDLMKKEEGKK